MVNSKYNRVGRGGDTCYVRYCSATYYIGKQIIDEARRAGYFSNGWRTIHSIPPFQ